MSAEVLRKAAKQVRHDYDGGTDTTSRAWLAVADWLDSCASAWHPSFAPLRFEHAFAVANAYLGESA